MTKEVYKIYKLIDPVDGSVRYVGLTMNSLNQRLKSHRNEKSKSHKSAWIESLKSKGNTPVIELIEEVYSYEQACDREIFWIDKLKQEGHKLTNHATGGNKNKRMSDEVRLKMSIAHKERNKLHRRVVSENAKKLISSSRKELMKDPRNREKLRITSKKFEESKTQEQKINDILIQPHKEVVQYDLLMNPISEYISINQAAKECKLFSTNISKCCHHKVSTVGGYIWRFKGDMSPMKEDKRHNRRTRSIIQYDLAGNIVDEFKSAKEAHNKTGISLTGIFECCNQRVSHSGGFIWRYKNKFDL